MCDHHLFIITVPNDWPISIHNDDDKELNKPNVNITMFSWQ